MSPDDFTHIGYWSLQVGQNHDVINDRKITWLELGIKFLVSRFYHVRLIFFGYTAVGCQRSTSYILVVGKVSGRKIPSLKNSFYMT